MQQGKEPPYSHDLRALATKAGIAIHPSQQEQLDIISTFNVRARYDTEKQALSRQATRAYTTQWFSNTKELYLWLKKQSQNP